LPGREPSSQSWSAGRVFAQNGPQGNGRSEPRRRDLPAWSVELPDATQALRQSEAYITHLRTFGMPDDDYDSAELIFVELVGNVCLHAPGAIRIQVEWSTGSATLHVTDEGPPIDMDAIAFPDPYAESGRGLATVNALSPAVRNITYAVNGKTLSAALPVRLNR
jgi:anti-sigma regulatory factor (Ser/Thr protein kinase)